MSVEKISYKEYCHLLNYVAYFLLKNKVNFVKRDKYSYKNKSKSRSKIENAISKHGESYTSSKYIARYVEMAVKDNKDRKFLPSHIYSDDKTKRYARDDYVSMVKRVLKYEKKHGKLPLNVKVKYTYMGKYGHATKSGCDNMGQNTGYYCGCHSLQEVFRNLTGKVVPQSTIASWAGTTSSGTGHWGLETAVAKFNREYGFNLTVEWRNLSDIGWGGVKKIIDSNNQDIVFHSCYRNRWGHYEVVNSLTSDNIKVQNSLGSYCGRCYCGYVENRTPSTFRSYIGGISQKSLMIITKK